MQDKRNEALKELQKNKTTEPTIEKFLAGYPPLDEAVCGVKPEGKIHYPEYWKKKKLNSDLVDRLRETANKGAIISDDYGEYKDGVFLHGSTIVVISITDGLWNVGIHSKHPVGQHVVKEIRYKYLPDAFLMAQLLPPRTELKSDCNVILYQIPGSLTENTKERG